MNFLEVYVYYPNISGFYLANDFYLNSNITGEQTLWLKSVEIWDFLSGSTYVQFYKFHVNIYSYWVQWLI